MLISIIIPTFNRASTLKASLMSVLSQTYSDIEVIVVDDASTDHTTAILSDIDDVRLKIIRLPQNSGAPNARNIGIKNASGEYLAFHDSDDVWLPHKLEEQIEFLGKGFRAVFCPYLRVQHHEVSIIPDLLRDQTIVLDDLLAASLVGTPTLVVERNLIEKNRLLFDNKLPRFQDWDFVIKISRFANIGYQAKPLVVVNVSDNSISQNSDNKFRALLNIYNYNYDDINKRSQLRLKWKIRILKSLTYTNFPYQNAKYYITETKNIYKIEKFFILFYTYFYEKLLLAKNSILH